MRNIDEMADELSTHFLIHDFKWKFDYGMANPDSEDIRAAINKAIEILEAEVSNSANLEVGHLLFMKRNNVIDVFVHTGTIGEE